MIKLKFLGETNENFEKNTDYRCTYLEIQEGKKAIMKIQDKNENILEFKYDKLEEFLKKWRLIKNED